MPSAKIRIATIASIRKKPPDRSTRRDSDGHARLSPEVKAIVGSHAAIWPPGDTVMRRQRTLPPARTQVPAAGFEMSIWYGAPSAVPPKPLNGTVPSKTAGAEAEPVTWIAAAPGAAVAFRTRLLGFHGHELRPPDPPP